MRRAALVCALLATLVAPATALAVTPRASLPDIENEVMCTTCKITLSIAESPQADRERAFIRNLIARGDDKQQIKDAMVGQYGPNVLALPKASGFGLTAYLVPIGLLVVLLAGLAFLLPSWRRRSAAGIADGTAARLTATDTRRLDEDLVRYD